MPQSPAKSLVRDARIAIEACPGLNSRLAARRIANFLEERMASSGLSLAQFGLMAQIAAAADDTLGALAARMGLDQSTLSRNLHGLERAGFVEIAVTQKDLRARAVWLTERGARILESAIPVWRRANAALARKIDAQVALRLARTTEALDFAD